MLNTGKRGGVKNLTIIKEVDEKRKEEEYTKDKEDISKRIRMMMNHKWEKNTNNIKCIAIVE